MTQKLLKIGSSAGVIIPKKSLEELDIKIGDRVNVEVDRKRPAIVVKPAYRVDKELLDWTRAFIKRYRLALEALAKK